ncbi:MAG: helix-turn-helix domain-containing protein [Deltaproteobacteria bacterium]|nr:helix-turn-helix domain-containing protein [Deltaproteobacteria bacterium]
MNLDEIREQLKDRRLSIVADATGLSTMTIARIRDGESDNPTIKTLQKLWDYLEDRK